LAAYPAFLAKADETFIYWRNGTKMPWSDGIGNKSPEVRLSSPDIEDMFAQKYVPASVAAPPPRDYDPGRTRHDHFFGKMYGASFNEVRRNLTTITWLPRLCGAKVEVTRINGVHSRLEAVSNALEQEIGIEHHRFLTATGGTFNWRPIAGTHRLSAHAYGIAIDLNGNALEYWRWDGHHKWRNSLPIEIVKVFERFGFIWGGRWYHYDTMHFEYRPELFLV